MQIGNIYIIYWITNSQIAEHFFQHSLNTLCIKQKVLIRRIDNRKMKIANRIWHTCTHTAAHAHLLLNLVCILQVLCVCVCDFESCFCMPCENLIIWRSQKLNSRTEKRMTNSWSAHTMRHWLQSMARRGWRGLNGRRGGCNAT